MRELGEVQVGIGCDERCTALHSLVAQRRRDDHAARLRGGELLAVAGVGEEGQRVARGIFQGPKPGDGQRGVADQFAAELRGDLTQRDAVHLAITSAMKR